MLGPFISENKWFIVTLCAISANHGLPQINTGINILFFNQLYQVLVFTSKVSISYIVRTCLTTVGLRTMATTKNPAPST